MQNFVEVEFLDINENKDILNLIQKVVEECFNEENLKNLNLYLNIILTNPNNIKNINEKYRNINKETDVLSFPMFEKQELEIIIKNKEKIPVQEVLGDIIISIPRVEKQAKEYGHTFERELSYMIVHGFYHIMGYDHIEESDRAIMRQKEERVLDILNIKRGV